MRRWTAWIPFAQPGTTKLRAVTAVNHADGRIEVLAIDDAGQVWRTAQTTPTDTNWSPLAKLSGLGDDHGRRRPQRQRQARAGQCRLGGGAWRRTRATPGTWSDWSRLSPRTLARVAAETGANGRIQLVGVDNLGNIWQSAQTSANAGTWSPWSQLDGQLRPDPYGW